MSLSQALNQFAQNLGRYQNVMVSPFCFLPLNKILRLLLFS